jgi:hypothetical protein
VIRQLIERDFLVRSVHDIRGSVELELQQATAGQRQPTAFMEEHEVEPRDLEAALAELSSSIDKIRSEPDAPALLPSYASGSLLQSALQRMYEERLPALLERREADRAVPLVEAVTDESLIDSAGSPGGDQLAGRMEQTDLRWAACLLAKGIRLYRGKRPFVDRPAAPRRLTNNARLYVLGDWASGVPRARKVSSLIRDMLTAPDMAGREQHVIHLGDAYYSGWAGEYEKNFLPHWPVKPGEEDRYGSWCLNANHDMFSGGYGYYDSLLADPRFRGQEGSSLFSLETDHWRVLAIDTAWENKDLAGSQQAWVETTLREKPRNGRKKSLLMSHHQPFSAFEGGTPKVHDKLRGVIDEGLVTGWFWGHEHRCAVYEPCDNIAYPRLVGHGGVPVWADNRPAPPTVRHVLQESMKSGFEKFGRFGFAVLDLNDKTIQVRYICERGLDQPGLVHYQEQLT